MAIGGVALALAASTGARPVRAGAGQATTPGAAGFVGSDVCAECHAVQYDAWAASTHGRAGGEPGPDVVIAPFDGSPIRFADAEVIPAASSTGAYTFTIRRPRRPDVVYRVSGVVGGGHLVGGGTQGFVSEMADGTVRFLPFDYSAHESDWFCNTGRIAGWWTPGSERDRLRKDEGWVPVTPELRLAECGDWPPTRVLGTDLRFANCQGCHGSQVTVEHRPDEARYATQVGSLSINCESCHGPASDHVALMREPPASTVRDPGLPRLSSLDEDGSLKVCFRCHALKRALQPGFVPGADFDTHYSTLLAGIGESPYYPDGRIRTFGYQLNHRQSACYLDGRTTCVDCHDPHGQGYRDASASPLSDRFDDGQCLACHASKGAALERHTGHPAQSAGSRCVSCHMPYLQQPELGDRIRYARSDHTIPLPRPGLDEAIGVPSACAQCHGDRTTGELAAWARVQWGALKPHDAVETALFEVRDRDRATIDAAGALALLRADHPNAMALVAGMNELARGPFGPDLATMDADVERALTSMTEHRDLDVRAVALALLHLARGDQPTVRAHLRRRLESPAPDQEAVVRRWVEALRYWADEYRTMGDPVTALEVLRKAAEIAPDAPGVLLDMGGLFDLLGDPAEAGDYYRRSLVSDPTQSVAWVNLGRTLEATGDTEGAVRAYQQALSVYSGEALAHLNLGNLILARGDYAEAVQWYQRATEADPGLSSAWFNLAVAYLGLDLSGQAALALRSALEFDPTDAEARALLADLEQGR